MNIQHIYRTLLPLIFFALITQGCTPPSPTKEPVTMPGLPVTTFVPVFAPRLGWVAPVRNASMMDVYSQGAILCVSEIRISGTDNAEILVFNADGAQIRREVTGYAGGVDDYRNTGTPVRAVVNNKTPGGCSIAFDIPATGTNTKASLFDISLTPFGRFATNPYARYSINTGFPGNTYPLGPFIARASRINDYLYTTWAIGTFTDNFKPFGGVSNINTCPTLGKADCFIVRYGGYGPIVNHQWGGMENDVAYAILGGKDGSATIFLQAGTNFSITSATQSLVQMTPGYNVVKLDTNGFLVSTYPVRLDVQGELARVEIAQADGDALYITGKDLGRNEYFLSKVSPAGTAWTRYLGKNISSQLTYFYMYFPQLGLTSDSQGNAYIAGNFYGSADFGGQTLQAGDVAQMFVASYSSNNMLRGALSMGTGTGVVVRLSPEEDAIYVTGWGTGPIMGVNIPDPNANLPTREREFRSPAFLVKLKLQ
jgi:hypothetical protein